MNAVIAVLHRLPELGVYLSLVLPVTSAMIIAPLIGRRLFRLADNDDRSRGALEAFKAIVASLAFLLAFTLTQAQSTLSATDSIVSHASSALNTIDRSLLRYDTEDFSQLRTSLHEMTGLIVSEEWPALEYVQRSPRVEALIDLLSRRIRSAEAKTMRQQTLLNELVGKLDEFTDRRDELIHQAEARLPAFFWHTIMAITVILMVLAFFVTPNRERLLIIAGITAAVMMLMALVVIVDAPFAGGSKISTAPIERVHALMKARQKLPAAP